MEKAIQFSVNHWVLMDVIYRVCDGYEHKHADTVPSGRVSVLLRLPGVDSLR